jgi:hypothetical protein
MNSAIVKVRSGIWRNAGEEQIVRRIAKVVAGTDEFVKIMPSPPIGFKWELKTNDWQVSPLSESLRDDEGAYAIIVVWYRYGHLNEKFMTSIENFLKWVF